jgi:hypothetical protein
MYLVSEATEEWISPITLHRMKKLGYVKVKAPEHIPLDFKEPYCAGVGEYQLLMRLHCYVADRNIAVFKLIEEATPY